MKKHLKKILSKKQIEYLKQYFDLDKDLKSISNTPNKKGLFTIQFFKIGDTDKIFEELKLIEGIDEINLNFGFFKVRDEFGNPYSKRNYSDTFIFKIKSLNNKG